MLVETGTFEGRTIASCLRSFDRIVSIEIVPELAVKAAARFAHAGHVTIINGDSAIELPRVVASLRGPATFWLDGHYSGEATGRGAVETPVVAELTTILESATAAIVLVDDARLFTGTDGYPTLEELRSLAKRLRPSSTFAVARDVIRIHAMKAF